MLKKPAAEEACYFVCLVYLVFWLNETNQMKSINQINKTNQINQPVLVPAVI
jgi:hypothetical protein